MALWGGRFNHATDDAVFALSRSVQFDWRLAPYDLAASLAHLEVLVAAKLIDNQRAQKLKGALIELRSEVAAGKFTPNERD